jgi:TetR/AcrR family transcriptional regulator, ethionamide resistance regulator
LIFVNPGRLMRTVMLRPMVSVTRKSEQRRATRRDEMRARLLEVVERLLSEGEHFTEISVERLVVEAGMARSTFYVYFEDKGDLLRAWFAEITAELRTAAAAWWRLGPLVRYDDVRDVLAGIVATYRPHTVLMAALYDTAAYDATVRELVTAMMGENAAGLRKHIRTGQREGFVDPALPPAQTAEWLTWMAERGLHQLVRTASGGELERLVDAYARIVWNTLYAGAARADRR